MARPTQCLEVIVIGPGVRDQRVNKSTVVVVGQGYVGLPLAMGAVGAGFDVVGIDVDERRVKRLVAGDSFIEDISSSETRRGTGDRPLSRQQRLGGRR